MFSRRQLVPTCISIAFSILFAVHSMANLSPEASFRKGIEAIAANQPDAIFALLPESYQKDVERVVTTFAENMDADIWTRGRGLMLRLGTVLQSKQTLLAQFASQQMAQEATPEATSKNIGALAKTVSRFAEGSLSDQARLRQGNVRELLATEGRALMTLAQAATAADDTQDDQSKNLWTLAKRATIRTESTSETDAVLHLTIADDQAETVELKQVENAWVPADMANGWTEGVQETMTRLNAMDFTTAQGAAQKQQVLSMITMLEGVLGQIEQAKSPEELQTSLFGIMMMMGAMGMPQMAP